MRAIAIGNFDGVHRGHLALLERARVLAAAEGLTAGALTFEPHPADVLTRSDPARRPLQRLAGPQRKVTLLELLVPEVWVEPFTPELTLETPEQFARRLLHGQLGVRHVVVGEDFRFGHGRSGDVGTLRTLGQSLGFEVHPLPLQTEGGITLSSSRARAALREGRPEEATTVLGRFHAIFGEVMHGDKRGRTLGMPTANILQSAEMFPARGIYAVLVGKGGPDRIVTRFARGVASVGTRPTIDPNETKESCEVHLFDIDEDLYGQILSVAFVTKLRNEERFDSLDALKHQMHLDLAQAREVLVHAHEDHLA